MQAPLGAAARLRLVLRLRRHGGGPAQGGGAGGAPAQDHVAGAVARREAGAALDARLPARLRRLSLSLLLVRQRLRHVSLMAVRISGGGRGGGRSAAAGKGGGGQRRAPDSCYSFISMTWLHFSTSKCQFCCQIGRKLLPCTKHWIVREILRCALRALFCSIDGF